MPLGGGVVALVCGMVIASVGLGGGCPMWCGVVSLWLSEGDRTGPSVRSVMTACVALAVSGGVGTTSSQLPLLQPWMVMGLGMCMQSRGLRGSGLEGPKQDTALDWIPYPQGTVHWIETQHK